MLTQAVVLPSRAVCIGINVKCIGMGVQEMIFSFLLGLREGEGACTLVRVDMIRDLCPWEEFGWPRPYRGRLRTMRRPGSLAGSRGIQKPLAFGCSRLEYPAICI